MALKNSVPLRRHPRAEVSIDASVVAPGDRAGRYRVTNLSGGGAFLIGKPLLKIGEHIDVQLILSAKESVRVGAIVVRTEVESADEVGLALSFCEIEPGVRQKLISLVNASLDTSRAKGESFVLVVDGNQNTRVQLERDLNVLGRHVAPAGFFLNALRWLQDPRARVEAAIVEMVSEVEHGSELLAYLREEFPWVRRVAMSNELNVKELDRALQSGLAQGVLLRPYGEARLRAALD